MSPLVADIIVIAILVLIISLACAYIYKERKKGRHCIGCPSAGRCPRRNMGCSGDSRAK